MSLTGNLDVFPLEEVLRLLARARKNGCLRVEAPGLHGRVYIAQGSLTFATTSTDDDVRRQIVNAGLVDEETLRRVEASDTALTDVLPQGVSAASLTDFVREQVVESLFRIRRPGTGTFDFALDLRPRFPTGQSFDVEVALSEADRRASEWADIETVVTDLHAPIRMARALPDENNVTVAPPTWRVLASLESGASVVELAEILGMSEFRAAREIAGLLRSRLVEYKQALAPAEPTWEAPTRPEPEPVGGWEPPPPPAWQGQPDPYTLPQGGASPAPAPEAAAEPGQWWSQSDQPAETAEPAAPPPGERPYGEVVEESDTDGFLERVFAEVEEEAEPGPGDEETGFSMGLLRRRRMGAIARDADENES